MADKWSDAEELTEKDTVKVWKDWRGSWTVAVKDLKKP